MARLKQHMHLLFRVDVIAQQKGYSRVKLSRKSGCTYATVNALWTNRHHDAMEVTLIKIARVLDVPTTELYTVVADEND